MERGVRVRSMSDYGINHIEVDKLVKFCKEASGEDLVLLLRAAVLTNEDIAATEIIRDMKRRETEAIGELSGILMDLDKVLYTLEVVQENSDIVGKSVNDGALFMMNRNRIYQNSSIAHDYVRGFEQKLTKTIDTLDTDDITEEEPAGDSNTDSAGETHTQEMESKKKFIVKTVEGIEAEKAINMIYAFVRKLAGEE